MKASPNNLTKSLPKAESMVACSASRISSKASAALANISIHACRAPKPARTRWQSNAATGPPRRWRGEIRSVSDYLHRLLSAPRHVLRLAADRDVRGQLIVDNHQ